MTEKDNDAETILSLKKKLKARDKELNMAATYGQQLLDLKAEALSQIEVLKQEKYSLQLKLQTETQSVTTQASEIEMYMKEVDCLKKENASLEKESSLLKQRNDNSVKEKQDLEKMIEDLQLENSTIKSKVAILEQQVEMLKNVSFVNDTRCEEDLPDVNELISKIKTLENATRELQNELESSKLSEKRLMQTVKELEEAVSDRDKNLSSEVQRIADLQETIAELKCEIETLKLGQLNVNRQGNSMFAELDDRRKNVEQQYKDLSKTYANVLKNYEKNKKELMSCKGQLSILACSTSKKHQEDQIKKLRGMLADAMHKKRELSEKLSQAEKALLNKPQVPVKGDQYNYLRVLNQQAEEKTTKVENELICERMRAMDFENRLFNSLKELYDCQESLQALKSENLALKQEIKEIKSKFDVCVSEPSESKKDMPGFESNRECKTLVQTDMKENIVPQGEDDINPRELISENGFMGMKQPRISNKAKLHSFHSLPKSEIKHLNDLPVESSLKVMNNQNNELITVTNENSEPSNIPEIKKSNCAQQ
ncbi:protein Spindly isoform X2 [Parasteatoda tepidariorum]|uniref:protein Spindly isoform X2 n=1 Tax=Parasteatoda tepidariorum TaxID=114398 RepID=UPI001C71F000|nr:protein Spindly isoform X2 [Parasteatoda tepidariorum]